MQTGFLLRALQAFVLFLAVSSTSLRAAQYYSAYGQSRTNNIAAASGTHTFEVDGIASDKWTRWYTNGVYTGTAQNDDSGFFAIDPDYSYTFGPGTTSIEARVYNSDFTVFHERHVWNVSILPNLAPYTPSGWSDKIVVSKTTNTTIDSSGLTTADSLYVDWSVKNIGDTATAARFYTELYVDGVLKKSWFVDPPLNAGDHVTLRDYSIGSLTLGTHTIRIKTDATGTVSESNGTDNEYTKTIIVTGPNLTPYQPGGWSDKIVVSKTSGTTTDSSGLVQTDTLYLDWAVINDGSLPTTNRFYTALYVDGVLKTYWSSDPPLNAGSFIKVQDYALGSLAVGTHTLKIVTDFTNGIPENSELDNEHTKTITITDNDPNDGIVGAFALGAINQTRTGLGQIDSPTDVDIFSFTVAAGQRISFDIDQTPPGFNSYIRLFDSNGTQLAANDNAHGPGPEETSIVNSYLEFTFSSAGTYYLGVSGAGNTNYNAVTGTGDSNGSTGLYTLVVSPGLAGNIQTSGAAVDFLRAGTIPLALDATKRTWVVIHGWNSSRANANIVSVTTNLVQARTGDQILTLDWSLAASSLLPDGAASAIVPVAQWAADALTNAGFRGTNLNLVGHSFGSYVADEIAQRIPGGVNSIVALDPAANAAPGAFDPVAEVNFALYSLYSWAFHSSSLGNEYTPATADEAFIVESGVDSLTAHGNVILLFSYLLSNPSDVVGQYFLLNNLLSATSGPWRANQYVSSFLFDAPVQGYEGIIQTTDAGLTPTTITFAATSPSLKVISVSTLTITNNEMTPLLGKGTDFATAQAGSNGATNYFTLSNSGGTALQIQSVAVPAGFQIVASPATPVPWAQSTTLGIRFGPGTAGTFSGNVFITNNTPGSSPFRFAITGTATNPLSAPVISVHPTNQFGVAGSNVLLSVSATGTTPLLYQWQKNGQAITDATNSTLNLTNLVRTAGGIFSVSITNQVGGITSSNAIVRVLVPQRFSQTPVRLGNGQVRLVFGDPTASALTVNELTNFVVEATTNVLSTNWVRYTNGLSIVGGMVQFDDADAPGSPRRFYRVLER